jgi:DNA-binding response OmpR family regulator
MAKILVVEDDPSIRRIIALAVKGDGHKVVEADSGDEGLSAVRTQSPDLVLLDVMLPGLDGIEVCRRIKSDPALSSTAVVMLTAKGEERDIVAGLDAGANDYVTKPFSKAVLLARLRAALRRDGNSSGGSISLDGLTLDDTTHVVECGGEDLKLTLTEYRILELLLRNRGRAFERSRIIDRISDGEKIVTDRTIDVQMVGLRRKLGDWASHIETIRGVGYRLE